VPGPPPDGPTPLGRLPPGQEGVVEAIQAGFALVRRLAALGIVSGTPVTVLANTMAGPIIVEVRGGRLALGRGEAMKVIVKPIAQALEQPEG